VFVEDVAYGSRAQEVGLDWDQEVLQVLEPLPQPSKYWMYIPALLVLAGIVWLQLRRREREAGAAQAARVTA
jgi:hypothetical protein